MKLRLNLNKNKMFMFLKIQTTIIFLLMKLNHENLKFSKVLLILIFCILNV